MGAAQHRGSTPASHQAALGLILGMPPKNSLDVAEIYWQQRFEFCTEA